MFRMVHLGVGLEVAHLNFAIEVANIAHDGLVLHFLHVLASDDVTTAGRGDEDIRDTDDVLQRGDLVAFHGGLQGANGVDFGNDNPGAEASHGLGTALADITIATDHDGLAGNHDVGGAFDAIGE